MINLFGLTFRLYGLLIGIGIYAAYQCSLWLARQKNIKEKIIKDIFWWTVIMGIVGARIYHVIDYWRQYYSLYPIKVFYVWEGGLGIWGGILGGMLGLLIYFAVTSFIGHTPGEDYRLPRVCQPSLFDLLDVAFFGLPLAQAIGRWGNYFNDELQGRNGEPLFLYESVLDLILFLILFSIHDPHTQGMHTHTPGVSGYTPGKPSYRNEKQGTIAGVYLIGYGLIRFLLEPMRAENMIWKIGGFPAASLFSIGAIISGMILLYFTYLKQFGGRR